MPDELNERAPSETPVWRRLHTDVTVHENKVKKSGVLSAPQNLTGRCPALPPLSPQNNQQLTMVEIPKPP
jgi:hypothetical protein